MACGDGLVEAETEGLLIAVIVLAALGGGVYWSDKIKTAEEKAPAKDAPPKVLTIPEDQFKSISLRKTGGDTTLVQKSDAGKWEITQPKPLAADQDSVGSVVSALSSLTSDRLIEDSAADLAPYGLASPPLEVVIPRRRQNRRPAGARYADRRQHFRRSRAIRECSACRRR